MSNGSVVIMDEMLQTLKNANVKAAVFLKNGIRLIGEIKQIDSEAILMSGPTRLGLAVMRDSIATVQEFSESERHNRSQSR